MNIWTSISSVIIILLLIALGYVLNEKGWFVEGFNKSISNLITKIALPCSIFVSVLKFFTKEKLIDLSSSLIWPMCGVIISYIIAFLLSKALRTRKGRIGTFRASFVNANAIFIGLPLNIALFGEKSLPYFLVYYIINTISLWSLGAFLIAKDSKDEAHSAQKITFKKLISKLLPPPLLGFLVSIVFLWFEIPVPEFANSALTYVGNLVTPLSLIFIGIVLNKSGLKSIRFDKDTIGVLLGRFVISPLVLFLLLLPIPLSSLLKQTLIVQSATATPTVTPMLAAEAGGDVDFATNTVATSTILFLFVVPVLMQLLQFV
ncbi:AEC family transporter [Bacillus glycinifermentans]|uniref:AEC family transporter n=1 Tax=Bacillus glycinifermentans TaxID=1664069 RepID=UPI001FF66EA8|nr:AEC family transporter [Bacillus glycinifermentans]MEC3608634.1 AEC family transporter [Bacillus glycinifermentans]UOY88134.1 AEC family transporter [Bacillus glycinifermentans]